MKSSLVRILNNQKFRFLLVGGFNTVFGYSAFAANFWIFGNTLGYVGCLVTSHLIASTLAYYLFSRIVFKDGNKGFSSFLKFQSAYIVPLISNAVALPLMVEGLRLNVYFAQAGFAACWVIASFFVHKYFTFRKTNRPG